MPQTTLSAAAPASRPKADHRLNTGVIERLKDPSIRVAVPVINSIDEAAIILNISRRKLCDLVAAGKLKVLRIGRRVQVTREALEKFAGTKFA